MSIHGGYAKKEAFFNKFKNKAFDLKMKSGWAGNANLITQ
jgi:hypothetical protein